MPIPTSHPLKSSCHLLIMFDTRDDCSKCFQNPVDIEHGLMLLIRRPIGTTSSQRWTSYYFCGVLVLYCVNVSISEIYHSSNLISMFPQMACHSSIVYRSVSNWYLCNVAIRLPASSYFLMSYVSVRFRSQIQSCRWTGKLIIACERAYIDDSNNLYIASVFCSNDSIG